MNAVYDLVQSGTSQRLRFVGGLPPGFHGEPDGDSWLCPLDTRNAAALRELFPWTAPQPVGLRKSVGCGDRLGLATPGHILALRGTSFFPVLAQQAMREMARCSRTPQQVIDDATWAAFALGYQGGFGADADHLKDIASVDRCLAAGFTGFTLDPSVHVDNAAQSDNASALFSKFGLLPWVALETRPVDLLRTYQRITPVGELSSETIYRAACKYSRAILQVVHLARHIDRHSGGRVVDLEISIDEASVATSPAEHYFIVSELRRMGIRFTGIAPRFVGRFEKGVEFIGDVTAFEADFAAHARIAQELGHYKLSIHTGSDKFSLYPIIARHAGQHFHIKTAGTSWLEGLRVIARRDPSLFREMLALAVECYPADRESYQVSADPAKIPPPSYDGALPGLLDQFDARQVLHVTYGSLLERFRARIFSVLEAYRDDYCETVRQHFQRHILAFETT